jgi:hypothetical protein
MGLPPVVSISVPFDTDIKGTFPQNIFNLKSGHICHLNSKNTGGFNKSLKIVANLAVLAIIWSSPCAEQSLHGSLPS